MPHGVRSPLRNHGGPQEVRSETDVADGLLGIDQKEDEIGSGQNRFRRYLNAEKIVQELVAGIVVSILITIILSLGSLFFWLMFGVRPSWVPLDDRPPAEADRIGQERPDRLEYPKSIECLVAIEEPVRATGSDRLIEPDTYVVDVVWSLPDDDLVLVGIRDQEMMVVPRSTLSKGCR